MTQEVKSHSPYCFMPGPPTLYHFKAINSLVLLHYTTLLPSDKTSCDNTFS